MKKESAQRLRAKAGLSQTVFWKNIGIGQSTGSRYEAGVTVIPECISLLLVVAYGTENQAQAIITKLRTRGLE